MRKYKNEQRVVSLLDSITCNKCGYEAVITDYKFDDQEFVGVENRYGYFSKYFGDGTDVQFDLCERCMWEFVQSFKHKAF